MRPISHHNSTREPDWSFHASLLSIHTSEMEENDPESTGERLRFLPPAEHESNQSENILTSTITITTIIIIIIIISKRYKKKREETLERNG